MIQLITRSQEAIQALHGRIWKVIRWVMESAGKSMVDGLEIALHLVDMLLSVPLQLTFNTVTAGLPGFTPEALTYASPLSTDQGAMTVLSKEILKGARGAEEKVMQATWCVTATNTGLVKVMTIGSEGGDDPNCPGTSLSLAAHVHPHSQVGTPLNIKHHAAHHTLLATCHLKTVILKAQDQGHILPIPVCRVLAA